MNNLQARLSEVIATLLYVGYVPYAPGTIASFVTVVAAYVFSFSRLNQPLVMLFLSVLFAIGCLSSHFFIRLSPSINSDDDPGIIVIDEVFGMMIALVCVPGDVMWYGMAFILFRIFDIAKPYPISFCERNIRGFLGIMLDDLLAGLGARFVLWAMMTLY
ncbi:MAG: phosphatidylglycerophosphatase A [Epsilonproteobacteria bacterium]|nr:phosphatidylglycerophosphatase A [Campylobacterota bacterium]